MAKRTKKSEWTLRAEELMSQGLDVVKAYQCEEGCDLTEDRPEGPLYECGECSTQFTKQSSPDGNHRCECGRFASRLYDLGCDQCEGGEVTEIDAINCPGCNELVDVDEWEAHLTDNEGCQDAAKEITKMAETIDEVVEETTSLPEPTKPGKTPKPTPEPKADPVPAKYPAPPQVKNFLPITETDEIFGTAPSENGMVNLYKYDGTSYGIVLTAKGKPEAWETKLHAKESACYRHLTA